MSVPQVVRLFHITAIANLPDICAAGALLAKNMVEQSGKRYKNIAYQGAQGKRANKVLPNPPGGLIHDYVPFYFAPRSPMLNAIHAGRVPDCPNGQNDLIHLETTVSAVVLSGTQFVFFDRNATLDYSESYTGIAHLNEIAWDLLTEAPCLDGFCKYFHSKPGTRHADRMERRMAEFLVKSQVPLNAFTRIGVIDENRRAEVDVILTAASVKLGANVMRDWYFLGQ